MDAAVGAPGATGTDGVPPGAAGPAGGARHRAVRITKIFVTVAVVAVIAYFVVRQWPDVRRTWQRLTWQTLLLATLAALGGMAASSMGWRAAARDIGNPVTFPAAARIFVISQLAKYIPGSLWVYVIQTELGKRAGVPRARAFLASLVAMGIGITAALIVGVAAVPALADPPDAASGYATWIRRGLVIMVVLFPVAIVCTVPRVLTRLVAVALRVLRRPPLAAPLTWRGVLQVLGWNVVTWLLFGVHMWLLVGPRAAHFPAGYLRCAGAFAVALTIGMFTLMPGGAGVREGVLIATLTPFLAGPSPLNAALGIAVASRIIFLIAEVTGAGLAALTDLGSLRRLVAAAGRGGGRVGERSPVGVGE